MAIISADLICGPGKRLVSALERAPCGFRCEIVDHIAEHVRENDCAILIDAGKAENGSVTHDHNQIMHLAPIGEHLVNDSNNHDFVPRSFCWRPSSSETLSR